MQVFRELFIRGEPEQLKATAEAICNSLSGDWSRDVEAEVRMRRTPPLGDVRNVYCFKCDKRGWRRAAALFLIDHDKQTYYVSNIVPNESPELSYAEYNGILEEFFNQFVQPAVARTGARAEMTEAEADLERWLTPDAAKKLRAFCLVANKRTGANHPTDRKFWYDFVVAAHRAGSDLDSSTLARWLQEVGGWNEEWADKLAIQYEYARGLLEHADRQAVGV
ncbi:MAG: hypothetical protein L0241_25610 [Planctomycetia bacterium]|nr:hypothetical protein [Planctomycetia bacterium]